MNSEGEMEGLIRENLLAQGSSDGGVMSGDSIDERNEAGTNVVVTKGPADPPNTNCHEYKVSFKTRAGSPEELVAELEWIKDITPQEVKEAITANGTFTVFSIEYEAPQDGDTDRHRTTETSFRLYATHTT